MDRPPEHHVVDLRSHHHETFEEDAEHESQHVTDDGEKDDLAEDVGVDLASREPEHLQARDLAHALLDVDVREVVQDDERERGGGHDEDQDDEVDDREHLTVAVDDLVGERHGRDSVHDAEVLREARADVRVIRDRSVERREDRLGLIDPTPRLPADVDVVGHVVLADPRDRKRVPVARGVADVILVEEDDRVADAHAELRGELLGDDHRVVVERHGGVADALVEGNGPAEGPGVFGNHNVGEQGAVIRARVRASPHVLLLDADGPRGVALLVEVACDGVDVRGRGVVREPDHHVVVDDGAVLAVDDVPDGIVQAEAHEEERRAARDADDRHEEAPLVAEEVPEGDLPREGDAAPQRRETLEQDALAGLGGAGKHERRGRLAQARDHGSPRRE